MQTIEAPLTDYLKKFFGFNGFKGEQEDIIQNLLDGNDSFVIMPTGGGKSLCYQLPALMSEGTAIIVSPLIALMKNQVDAIRGFSDKDGIAHFYNSTLNKTEAKQVKKDVQDGITKLLYVAPESLTKEENIEFLKSFKISFFAIDEAHCISEWGHDFRPEYRRLRTIIEAIDRVPIIALTATATPKVQEDIQKNLGMTEARVFKASFNRDNLYYEIRPKKDVKKEIIRFVRQHQGKSGIIYCLSRKKVEEIAELLQVNGIKALPYHAGLDSHSRVRHQDMFLMEEADVIVATIAFGMGIDKPDVRYVIHHDIPKSLESYYQETGRAGRDGGEGICVAYYSYKDIEKLEKFLHGKPVAEMEIGMQLIFEMVSYAETAVCRRKQLLNYFGEKYDESDCQDQGMCDNCSSPKEKFEGKDDVKLLLQAVLGLNENFKSKYIAHFVAGNATSEIKSFNHNNHPLFGTGKDTDKDDKYWEAVVRQCTIEGLLTKEIENYGILRVSEKGKAFIEKPTSITLIKPNDYSDVDDGDVIIPQKSSGAADEALFNILKDVRKSLAKELKLPPYVIFQDPSLEDMATRYPITTEELTNITGVGQGKAEKYGEEFLEVIAQYVEDNDIDRPMDLVVKSVVNKSGLKVYVIQSIDRKIALDDIADAKGIELGDVITEIEHIVQSGTKVNLDYYINEEIDEADQEEVFDYFMEAESDSIEDALYEFDNAFTEEEMRLLRIKFMSEVAN
ncbi:MAG: DNA helicase RecQ [Flavobacteriales bacterium]|jgi:ATP-dependent DNA helicase RecQ|nr:DNA helicase RecQ [Flavobacteriales bacterium]MCW8911726.1 DNA helicase RecQ [Flavobacteriales bacterium]MCW8936985.1 DNA helicase RecQ [Flavobacteriales bacterium]MCW8940152.1 DNA helicase RecQ [Flavobacteriales bacterium]MCW8968771.1 DNA helicase RecQ [Flavobacteriales bacterium]